MRRQIRLAVLIVALGALVAILNPSTTIGATVPDPSPTTSLVILGASYAKNWGSPAVPGYNRVINRGVGGDETGGMRERIATDVIALEPDAVLIWGHVNNITRSAPDRIEAAKTAARYDYDEMLRQARAAGIQVIFATEVPWTESSGFLNVIYGWIAGMRGKTSYAERVSSHVSEVNDHLRTLAKREGLQLLDFERVFANEDGTRKAEYGADDSSHITKAGYDALSEYARKELSRAQ